MSFLPKNKPIIVILLMVGFFIVILMTFISGVSNPDGKPTPTEGGFSGPAVLATSTINITPSTPHPSGTQVAAPPSETSEPPPGVTAQSVTEPAPLPPLVSSPSPTIEFQVTEAFPGTDAPPPPTFELSVTDVGPFVTDFPPPLTFVPPPTETPPPGNGPPPGS